MRQDVRRRSQKLIARSHGRCGFFLKVIQVDVSQYAVLGHRDERIDHRGCEHVAVHLGVVPNVGDEFVVSHDQVITMVTLPTNPYPVTKVWGG